VGGKEINPFNFLFTFGYETNNQKEYLARKRERDKL